MDEDGTKYQGIADITKVDPLGDGENTTTISVCEVTRCNARNLVQSPTESITLPLAYGDTSGNNIELPQRPTSYYRSTPAHEFGHNLGLNNCRECNSIMSPASRSRPNKITIDDVKMLYNNYKKN